MAGPNMEVFKFGVYIFFPITLMYYFGEPGFYNKYVKHIKFWPDREATHQPPTNQSDLKEELARLRSERLAKRLERDAAMHQQNQERS